MKLITLPFRLLRWFFRRLLRAASRPDYVVRNPLVIDGDTIFSDGRKIRLHGIDAPEMDQAGGAEAKAALQSLLRGRPVRIEPLDTDRYGRTVARLHTDRDICQAMVRAGFAVASFHHDYRRDEIRARRKRTGLWARGGIDDPAAHRRARGAA
jgi:micrococcal nuclease